MQRPAFALAGTAAVAGLVIALVTGQLGALALVAAAPLAAAVALPPRFVAVVAAVALGVVAVAGAAGDAFSAPHVTALVAVAVASAGALALAFELQVLDRRASFATFMEEATTLLACSLDFDATAKSVASIPVPELADWALVELIGSDGAVERRAASGPDPASESLAAAIAAAAEGARGPRAELWPELPDALLESWARGEEERLATLRGAGAGAAIRVPLRSAERVLGTMTLLAGASTRSFAERDLRRAEELAVRCALAIENAHQYRAARRLGERRFARRTEAPPAPDRPSGRSTD